LLLPPAASLLVFAALGLGLALPFVAIALIPALRARLPKPGSWMRRLQRFLAIPMAASAVAALWLLWRQSGGAALVVGIVAALLLGAILALIGLAERQGARRAWAGAVAALGIAVVAIGLVPGREAAVASVPAGTERWSEAAVARAQAANRPVFVYFTADWCLTCKVNEAAAIDRSEVRNAFKAADVVVLAADWTNGDPAITRYLESRGRAGVPYYLWYAPGRAPEELPQVLTPAMLISRAREVKS
jgi:thiol:disulfide interchange protein